MQIKFLGVDHGRHRGQRHCATGITRAAATRDDRETKLDTRGHQWGHFFFGIGVQHHKWIFNAPVRGIGHVGYAGEAIKLDIVAFGMPMQAFEHFLAQRGSAMKTVAKSIYRLARAHHKYTHALVTGTALFHLVNPVLHGFNQHAQALGVIEQIIFKIRVALHGPDIAQHLKQHACRSPGHPLPS